MKKLILFSAASIIMGMCVGCMSPVYQVRVVDESGSPLKSAYVTATHLGKSFKQVTTGIDGIAELKGTYEGVPERIKVQKSGYYEQHVKWQLPSAIPQSIMMKKY